jgi:HEAT repeat protein
MSAARLIDEYFRSTDFGVLDRLGAHDRDEAIDLLLAAARRGEVAAIQGLAHLQADRAIEPLRAVLREYDGVVRVYAAAALWWLCGDGEALQALCREATHRPRLREAPHRVHAAAVLSHIDHHEARRALARLIHDPEYVLRYHAYEGLSAVLGRRREIWNYVCKPDIHHHVRSRIDAALQRAGLD